MDKWDFKYYNFTLNRGVMRDYIESTVSERKYMKWHSGACDYQSNITNSIIAAIAQNSIEFNKQDSEMLEILEDMIRKCGYGTDGKYSKTAHQAMQNLCLIRGLNKDAIKLYDHTITGKIQQGKEKLKNLFGFKKKKTIAPQQKNNNGIKIVAAGIALFALTTMLTGEKDSNNHAKEKEPAKKENIQTVKQTPIIHTQTPISQPQENITQTKNIEADQQLQSINNFCDSSLDILMGTQKRDALYNKIQNQVNRGIFKIPEGMSVQRIAHAMEMSRIYEGKSVILDALNTNTQLTDAQQEAFKNHIDGIGIRGEKLQQRISKQQKLSSYSKFDHSSKAQQSKHIKNLKQLRQMRARTR